jgi:hypothetical protein
MTSADATRCINDLQNNQLPASERMIANKGGEHGINAEVQTKIDLDN